ILELRVDDGREVQLEKIDLRACFRNPCQEVLVKCTAFGRIGLDSGLVHELIRLWTRPASNVHEYGARLNAIRMEEAMDAQHGVGEIVDEVRREREIIVRIESL